MVEPLPITLNSITYYNPQLRTSDKCRESGYIGNQCRIQPEGLLDRHPSSKAMNEPSDSQPSPLIRTSPEQSTSIATAIVNAIERVDGDKPDTLLYEVIEPDALEALYEHGKQRVQFQYADYQVTIQPDQTILVSEPNT